MAPRRMVLPDGQEHRLQAAPVKGDVDAVVLDVKAGDVVRSDEGHVSLPFVAVFRLTNSTAAARPCSKSATMVANF